jgi:spore coat protein JC
MTMEQIKASGFDTYFVDHTAGIYPQAASGMPFTAAVFQSKGDAITDLVEDMAADAAPLERQLLSKGGSKLF